MLPDHLRVSVMLEPELLIYDAAHILAYVLTSRQADGFKLNLGCCRQQEHNPTSDPVVKTSIAAGIQIS